MCSTTGDENLTPVVVGAGREGRVVLAGATGAGAACVAAAGPPDAGRDDCPGAPCEGDVDGGATLTGAPGDDRRTAACGCLTFAASTIAPPTTSTASPAATQGCWIRLANEGGGAGAAGRLTRARGVAGFAVFPDVRSAAAAVFGT